MAFQDPRSRLHDMLDAIADVTEFTAGKSFDDYLARKLTRHAVERCVEIISEASRHLPAAMKDRYPGIPWRKVADVGNVLRHAYRSIDGTIVWQIATEHLPPLKAAVEALLREIESQDKA